MTNASLRILLSTNSRDGTDRINQMFRDAGHSAQTHRVTSIEDLSQCLNDEHWDLALCEQQNTEIDMNSVLEHIVQSQADTPVILLTNEITNDMVVDGLSRGAQDVIQISHQQHLLYAANREISNLQIRRRHEELERSLGEVSDRFDTLMSTADDAVAYVLDGMHIDVNEAYQEIFGIEDEDDFLAIPLVDLIAEDNQAQFKAYLRDYKERDGEELEVSCTTPEGKSFQASIKCAAAVFDEEDCVQIIVRPVNEMVASSDSSTSDMDPVTGLRTRYSMVSQLDSHTADDNASGCLLYIGINGFSALKSRLGLSGSRVLLHDFASLVAARFADSDAATVAHYDEDSFTVLLPGIDSTKATTEAASLCQLLEQHFFEIEDQTVQSTCSVGIIDFSNAAFSDASGAMDSAFVALEQARVSSNEGAIAAVAVFAGPEPEPVDIGTDVPALVEADRLRMVFQPIINLHGEPMESYEATLRLTDAEGQEQPIEKLVQAVSQKSGDTTLDSWLVAEGIRHLKALIETGKPAGLTINLTQNALIDTGFGSWLHAALNAAQIAPETITLQFTEKTIGHYLKQAIRLREELGQQNFKFSLSKFGRAGDSFKILQHFKVDYTFVDPEFALELRKDPTATVELKQVLDKLDGMEIKSVVPFVENAATLASLWQMNAHYIQGYYLQAPSEQMDYEFADSI